MSLFSWKFIDLLLTLGTELQFSESENISFLFLYSL